MKSGVNRSRWLFLPLGLSALAAVGAHAAADVVAHRALLFATHVDAFLSRFSFLAPLVDIVSASQRTWLSRALALVLELSTDALIAIPLLGYDERDGKQELKLARGYFKKMKPWRLARPLAAVLLSIAGACAVARLVRATLLHLPFLAGLLAATVLFSLLVLLVPRAAFRSLEREAARAKPSRLTLIILLPLAIAAIGAFR
jgi:hypothetical protein